MANNTDNISNVLFVTYGDHSFRNSKKLLCSEAQHFGFEKIVAASPESLSPEFVKRHSSFIKSSRRGAGYWLWKPYIVNKYLNSIREGEFLLYADAGCTINTRGKDRFHQWLEMADAHEMLSFQMQHLEKKWTKMNLVEFMNCKNASVLETGQLIATTFLLKKTKRTAEMISEWLDICELEWTINDDPSSVSNDAEFIEHRHDQSVFSLLRKRENCFTIDDETYPFNHDWSSSITKLVPVLATRRKF